MATPVMPSVSLAQAVKRAATTKHGQAAENTRASKAPLNQQWNDGYARRTFFRRPRRGRSYKAAVGRRKPAKKVKEFYMRSFIKLFLVIAFIEAIMFSIVGCGPNNEYDLLNGVWDRGDIVVTFSDDSAVFTQINSNSEWKPVQNNGSISIGDKKFRNIDKTGDKTWACQERIYYINTYVTDWRDATLTLSSNGQSLRSYRQGASPSTYYYTKK